MTGAEPQGAEALAPMLATLFFVAAWLMFRQQPQCVRCSGIGKHEDDCPFKKD